jgi:hypothetical protein
VLLLYAMQTAFCMSKYKSCHKCLQLFYNVMISSLVYGTNISEELVASVMRYGRLFYTEDGGRNFFRIVESCLPNYKASRLKECNLYTEHCQNDGFRMLV